MRTPDKLQDRSTDPSLQAQEAVEKKRSSQEIEQQNQLNAQHEAQKVQATQLPTPEHMGAAKIESASSNAAKQQDKGRDWQQFAQQEDQALKAQQTLVLQSQQAKVNQAQQVQSIAAFARQRDGIGKA